MLPRYIFLVRHGESIANVDKSLYEHTPDWKMTLTENGKIQAQVAGEEIVKQASDALVHPTTFMVYISPWYRTRETTDGIISRIKKHGGEIHAVYEDPRLREQEWGNYMNQAHRDKIDAERDRFGTFFYRMRDGESGADVYDRVSSFLDTLFRDFQKDGYPGNVVVVTHGLTLRLFLMRWFHWTVEQFEELANPSNGFVAVMELQPWGKYELLTTMRRKIDE